MPSPVYSPDDPQRNSSRIANPEDIADITLRRLVLARKSLSEMSQAVEDLKAALSDAWDQLSDISTAYLSTAEGESALRVVYEPWMDDAGFVHGWECPDWLFDFDTGERDCVEVVDESSL